MSNIEKKNTDLIDTLISNPLQDIIKPLVKEIYLFHTTVAGTSYIDDQTLFDNLNIDDKLILKREENKYDKKAIVILNESNVKIGYVKREDNIIFSRLMDAGKLLTAKVREKSKKGKYNQIDINIYLIDF